MSVISVMIDARGELRMIYDDRVDFRDLGRLLISRASHVEPDAKGHWIADLNPVNGPILGPFEKRTEALDAEQQWIEQNRLMSRR